MTMCTDMSVDVCKDMGLDLCMNMSRKCAQALRSSISRTLPVAGTDAGVGPRDACSNGPFITA